MVSSVQSSASDQRWWIRRGRGRAAVCRLVCFAHAGAGATSYATWSSLLPPSWELIAAQLPGRENRLAELPLTSLGEMVSALLVNGRSVFEPPFVLFGHSVGAIIAFEMARALEQAGASGPAHLFVSGRMAPSLTHSTPRRVEDTDASLIAQLRDYGGTDPGALDNPELLELVLPALRADMRAERQYMHETGALTQTAVTAFGGTCDPFVSEQEIAAWSAVTSGPFAYQMFEGGHFFLRAHAAAMIERMRASVAADPAGSRGP
ncbi:MAG: thioesterase II family protein [Gemmatimonadaceae bacterium]|jgi:medium-chain acyl-[acyl-carrier-protein] hydrolase